MRSGRSLGSFANVCIHRLPKGASVVSPRSRCPACLAPIAAWDNVPILSWLVLRGRCRACRAAISPRYPLVEALVGALFLAAAFLHGLGPVALAGALLATAAVILAATDLEARVLPDEITFGVLGLGLVLAAWRDVSTVRTDGLRGLDEHFLPALAGAAFGAMVVWGVGAAYRPCAERKGWGWAT
ncbi:MAG: prepilin peptidase [Holophagales bacterium]|nr:prepilin peptidase [Holophagales bacterium]